jgi:DNA-binding NtrC family response regulator
VPPGPEQLRDFQLMAENFPSLQVLVVEDELLIRWSLAEILGHAGYSVTEAADAASAIRAVKDAPAPFDVILLDYRLPDSDDLDLLATLRRLTPRTAIVLMTAFGTPEVTQGALQLGVCRILNKPFDMHDIAAVVLDARRLGPLM